MIIEITSVSPVELIVCTWYWHKKALVFPIPYKLTRQRRVFLIEIEHLPHITHRVTHGMAVFTLDMGAGSGLLLPRFTYLFDTIITSVHRAVYIAPLAVTLIMGQTGVIKRFDRFLHMFKVVSSAGFITI